MQERSAQLIGMRDVRQARRVVNTIGRGMSRSTGNRMNIAIVTKKGTSISPPGGGEISANFVDLLSAGIRKKTGVDESQVQVVHFKVF